jgi:hypothetical protein
VPGIRRHADLRAVEMTLGFAQAQTTLSTGTIEKEFKIPLDTMPQLKCRIIKRLIDAERQSKTLPS